LPPEVENEFLNCVLDYEMKFKDSKLIRIRERLGDVSHLKPVENVPDEEIEFAWRELDELLAENGISLSACSPRITSRELYRFTTQELFELEMDDINIPGMINCFIYDEFYPDPIYECENTAINTCLRTIFSTEPMEFSFGFAENDIELNGTTSDTSEVLFTRINRFKDLFEEIEVEEILCNSCIPLETTANVSGSYVLQASIDNEKFRIAGTWEISLLKHDKVEYWFANKLVIRGIDFI
jgi:hypothetical protein